MFSTEVVFTAECRGSLTKPVLTHYNTAFNLTLTHRHITFSTYSYTHTKTLVSPDLTNDFIVDACAH